VNNIKMDPRKIRMGWYGLDQFGSGYGLVGGGGLVNTLMNLRVPINAGKFLSSCVIGGYSRRFQLHELF
jgi:hypothetical protein